MPAFSKSISLETALGLLSFTVSIKGIDVSSKQLSVGVHPILPSLLSGMSVKKCNAIVIKIGESLKPFSIEYAAKLISNSKGSACTGQGLAAMEWEDNQSIVVIGTDNEDALTYRMPWAKIKAYENYTSSSLTMRFAETQYAEEMSFHLIIAENPIPEPYPDSAWFAVDIGHNEIIASLDK